MNLITFAFRMVLSAGFLLHSGLIVVSGLGSPDDQTSFHEHVELGEVHWNRNFEQAKSRARSDGKPIFLLFQEVPGCQTCQNYGNQPLSHPLLVEAIEDLFVPVAIFNNKPGGDANVLSRFEEPAWNNPVVRYLNHEEDDILPRQDRVWNTDGTANRMMAALRAAGEPIPDYLSLISSGDNRHVQTAEFAMHCYWEGEAKLGGIGGVVSTRAGWRDQLEVVEVKYLPSVVDYASLLKMAQSFDCASWVYTHSDEQFQIARSIAGDNVRMASGAMRDAKPFDQKYYLNRTHYRYLPLTQPQACRINAAIANQKPIDQLLSPRQRELASRIKSAIAADNTSLQGLSYPVDQNRLADYQQKLLRRLREIHPPK